MSCLVSDPRVPSARIVIFACKSYPGSKFDFGWLVLVEAFVVGANAAHAIAVVQKLRAGKPVNTVTPASSTLPPSHFTKRLSEIT